jgi:hypothetical protein
MQCLGRTKAGYRCKNDAQVLFCRQHRWQPFVACLSAISFVGLVAGLYQDVWRSILFKEMQVPAVHGETYTIARALLIRSGWTPQINHVGQGELPEKMSGNGPHFWQKGYHELDYCSGTGYALCRFEFTDPAGNLLVVITRGEADEGSDDGVTVFRAYLNPKNEEGAYGDTLGIEKVTPQQMHDVLEAEREAYRRNNPRPAER